MPLRSELTPKRTPNKDVFIVHGTDHTSLKELKTLLEDVGLNPIILHEQPSKGMTLIEKLEEYSNVGFAFIILTPDDLGLSKIELAKIFSPAMQNQESTFNILLARAGAAIQKHEPSIDEIKEFLVSADQKDRQYLLIEEFDRLKDRARQNVILEFGYFIGKLGRRQVCCLYKGNIELPSDVGGICYVHFENSVSEAKEIILKELKATGYEVKTVR